MLAGRVHAEVGPIQVTPELVDRDEVHGLKQETFTNDVGGQTDHHLRKVSLPVAEIDGVRLLVRELARRTPTRLPRLGQRGALDLFVDLRFGPLHRDGPDWRGGP